MKKSYRILKIIARVGTGWPNSVMNRKSKGKGVPGSALLVGMAPDFFAGRTKSGKERIPYFNRPDAIPFSCIFSAGL